MRPVELFHIGPQKSGTTWIYRCLAEHPEIAVPPKDSVHYFDMHFDRGRAWYAQHFAGAAPGRKLFDPTPSYVRSPLVPRRVARENPAARIAVCLRDPVERAFSHYWHEKKKRRIDYAFAEVLENYDLFASWLEPGFHAEHLERWLAHFDREQLLCQRFERIAADPGGFLDELCAHFGVATGHRPAVMTRKVNAAGPRRRLVPRALHAADKVLQRAGVPAGALVSGRREYERGIEPGLEARLRALCEPEIARLEALLGVDLSDWRRPPHAA